jgi:hypothetical protein
MQRSSSQGKAEEEETPKKTSEQTEETADSQDGKD